MPKTDLDHPPVESTPETQARTPWESIDPSEPAQAESSAGTRAKVSRPPADFKPVRAKIRRGAAKPKSPFASTAISAAVAGMADFASEIQALVNSQQFSHEQEIVTAQAESPEEQVVTQAFLSDSRGTGILPMSGDADRAANSSFVGRHAEEALPTKHLAGDLTSATSLQDPSSAKPPQDDVQQISHEFPIELPVGSALADALRGSDNTETASAKADPTNQSLVAPRFSASSIEPTVEPATIDETPWAKMNADDVDTTVSLPVTAFIDIPGESPFLDRLATLDLSDADLDVLDTTDLNELTRGDLAVNRHVEADRPMVAGPSEPESQPEPAETISIPQASTDDAAVTFAMTDPVTASIPQMGIVSEPVPIEEERAGDATVVVPERQADVEGEHAITAPQLALEPQTETEPQWVLEAEISPAPVTTGGTWTIPLMCLGIGLIGCCMAIPQIDFNRRLRYEQRSLAANLESVQKQVAVNDEFLKKVMDDPTLAERLAGRQMKTMRKGQRVIPLEHVSDDGDMSPFALVAVAPPPEPPPYKPIRGTIANLCYDARSRLYLLGSAMGMVAVGLVMGFSPLRPEQP